MLLAQTLGEMRARAAAATGSGLFGGGPAAWPPATRTHTPPAISPLLPANLVASFDNVVSYSTRWLQGLTADASPRRTGLVGLAGISSV